MINLDPISVEVRLAKLALKVEELEKTRLLRVERLLAIGAVLQGLFVALLIFLLKK